MDREAGLAGKVAPHWGAWIEIEIAAVNSDDVMGRTPLGCVD